MSALFNSVNFPKIDTQYNSILLIKGVEKLSPRPATSDSEQSKTHLI